MTAPVARLASGQAVDVDLTGEIDVSTARRRIAKTTGVPFCRVRLLNPGTPAFLLDNEALGPELEVIFLNVERRKARRCRCGSRAPKIEDEV